MDKVKSIELSKKLKGTTLKDFRIVDLINNGKSAAVFRAEKDNHPYALKIFDNELIERFGHEIQTKRIEQEISLKDHSINNLVKIFEGGKTTVDSDEYYFIVMELIEGKNLKEFIESNTYDQNFIVNTIQSLTTTTEELLNKYGIAHRDIKPENIMVNSDNQIVLMDLGVLKLIGAKSFSDEEEKQFVGTLRYAAPEFLLRTEEDSIEGWRAINLYQIGATAHDLIMKKELFHDKTPYANLVIAIKDDVPRLTNITFTFELLQLTRDLLSKDWRKRLQLCPLSKLMALAVGDKSKDELENGIDEILKMRMGNQAKFDEIERLTRSKDEIRQKQNSLAQKIAKEFDNCFDDLRKKGIFSLFSKSKNFKFDTDKREHESIIQNFLYELRGDLKMGFPKNLYILVRIANDENSYTEIELLGIFPSAFARPGIESPLSLFQELGKERQGRYASQGTYSFKTINIFKGVIDLDESFNVHVKTQLIKLISKALKSVEKTVQDEIKWQEDIVKSKGSISRTSFGQGTILIDSL